MNTTLSNTIKTIDSRLFAGALSRLNRYRRKIIFYLYKSSIQYIYTRKINAMFKYNNSNLFISKKQNYLGDLLDRYGSVKIESYKNIYYLLFFQHKNKTKLVLECGIGSKNLEISSNMSNFEYSIPGGSLRAWRDYFSNAQVIGIDIDPDVMFTEERIRTYVCDQTSKQSINNFINQAELKTNTVDIIIDDGLHEFNANISLFENTKHLLKDSGIYVIEDFRIDSKEQNKYIDYFKNLDIYYIYFIKCFPLYLIVITKKNA